MLSEELVSPILVFPMARVTVAHLLFVLLAFGLASPALQDAMAQEHFNSNDNGEPNGNSGKTGPQYQIGNPFCPPPKGYIDGHQFTPLNWSCPGDQPQPAPQIPTFNPGEENVAGSCQTTLEQYGNYNSRPACLQGGVLDWCKENEAKTGCEGILAQAGVKLKGGALQDNQYVAPNMYPQQQMVPDPTYRPTLQPTVRPKPKPQPQSKPQPPSKSRPVTETPPEMTVPLEGNVADNDNPRLYGFVPDVQGHPLWINIPAGGVSGQVYQGVPVPTSSGANPFRFAKGIMVFDGRNYRFIFQSLQMASGQEMIGKFRQIGAGNQAGPNAGFKIILQTTPQH